MTTLHDQTGVGAGLLRNLLGNLVSQTTLGCPLREDQALEKQGLESRSREDGRGSIISKRRATTWAHSTLRVALPGTDHHAGVLESGLYREELGKSDAGRRCLPSSPLHLPERVSR